MGIGAGLYIYDVS